MRKNRLFTKDYDGAINEIPQNKMMVTHNEAKQLFADHSAFGDKKVLIPKAECQETFENMKGEINYEIFSSAANEPGILGDFQ